MQDRHKIHIALPRRPAIRSALENALRVASNLHLGNYDLTDKIDDAEVVVTDSETQSNEIGRLPDSVRYLQLIDCGSGAPNMTSDDLTVANASSLLVQRSDQLGNRPVARNRTPIIQNPAKSPECRRNHRFRILGLRTRQTVEQIRERKFWVNDIRTPKQMSFQSVRGSPVLARSCSCLNQRHRVSSPSITDPTSNPLLSRRELGLLEIGATIINMSGGKVVDRGSDQDVERVPRAKHRLPRDAVRSR